jgi:hypothetical protein
MLKAIARAEAQLRLAAELLGQLRVRMDVRVIRSLNDLTDEELQSVIAEWPVGEGNQEPVRLLPAGEDVR